MYVEVSIILIILHREQRTGVVDLTGIRYLIPTSVTIESCRICRVECRRRIKQFLREWNIIVLLQRTEYAQVYSEMIILHEPAACYRVKEIGIIPLVNDCHT